MKLGRVIGRVVLSKKDSALGGGFMLVVSPLDNGQYRDKNFSGMSKQPNLVVFDIIGASFGDIIGYVEGAEATAAFSHPIPIDAYSVGIVDSFNYAG